MKYRSPLEEHKFKKLVKNFGYIIEKTSKHHIIKDSKGNKLMAFAVDHSKSGKREVKEFYVNKFLNEIKQLEDK